MLVGNQETFAIQTVPVAPTWDLRCGPEGAAWAGLSIWVGGANLCRHVWPGSGQVEDALFVPLAPLADWIVRTFGAIWHEERAPDFPTTASAHESVQRWGNRPPPAGLTFDAWVDAREAWWSRHFLAAGADGSHVPNVAFVREDEELTVTWGPPRFAGRPAPQLLVPAGTFTLSREEATTTLARFVAMVASSLGDAGLAGAYEWVVPADPLGAAKLGIEEAVYLFTGRTREELQALTGANDATEVLARLGPSAASLSPGESPVPQALRDLPRHLPAGFGQALRDLDVRSVRSPIKALSERMLAGARADGAAVTIVLDTPLNRYGIGARTAAWQLWNHELLSSPGVRDDLIESFARGPRE